MPEQDCTAPAPPDPAVALRHMIMGFRVTQLIYVAAKLGIADHLRLGPQSIETLAGVSGAHPRALYRLLRALVLRFINNTQVMLPSWDSRVGPL
jgi:hypothetical protein